MVQYVRAIPRIYFRCIDPDLQCLEAVGKVPLCHPEALGERISRCQFEEVLHLRLRMNSRNFTPWPSYAIVDIEQYMYVSRSIIHYRMMHIFFRSIIPAFLCLFLFQGIIHAQNTVWRRVNTRYTPSPVCMTTDDVDFIYIGDNYGQVFRYDDVTGLYTGSTYGFGPNRTVVDLIAHPEDILLALVRNNESSQEPVYSVGLSRSRGDRWSMVDPTPYRFSNAVIMGHDGYFYLGTDSSCILQMSPDGLEFFTHPLPETGRIEGFAIDQKGRILASLSREDGSGSLLRSAPNGSGWERILTIPHGHLDVIKIAGDSTILGWRTTTAPVQIFRSMNNGVSWDSANTTYYPTSPGQVLAVPAGLFLCYGGTIQKSTDNGRTYTKVSSDFNPFMINQRDDGSLVATNSAFIYRSTNGMSWETFSSILPDDIFEGFPASGLRAIASTMQRSVLTGGDGMGAYLLHELPSRFWWRLNLEASVVRSIAAIDTSRFYVATEQGILATRDGGSTWWMSAGTIPGLNFTSVAGDSNLRVYAGTSDSGIYVSGNAGITWVRASTGLADGAIEWIYVDYRGRVYTSINGRVFYSLNSGASWQPFLTALPATQIRAMRVEPGLYDKGLAPYNSREHYIIGTERGVFISTDSTRTWSHPSTGLMDSTINALAFAADGSLVAGTNNGIYSYNLRSGEAWQDISNTLAGKRIIALTIYPCDRITPRIPEGIYCDYPLYALTNDGALYAQEKVASVRNQESGATGIISAVTASPNPFNGTLRFTVDLAAGTELTLEIFSANGEQVAKIASGRYHQGVHELAWEPADLPEGSYFYRLKAGKDLYTGRIVRAR